MTKPRGKKSFLIALLALIAMGAVMAIFRRGQGSSIGRMVSYSDGTTLTLKEVTYGTEHRYQGGGLRERLISLLPGKYAAKYASRRNVLRTDQPSVTLWLDRRGTAARTSGLVLCDADGFGIEADYSMMKLDPPNSTVEGWAFVAWPRRGRIFTVRVYEHGKRYGEATLLGEFTVRNPRQEDYPTWPAPSLPMTGDERGPFRDTVRLRRGSRPRIVEVETCSEPDGVRNTGWLSSQLEGPTNPAMGHRDDGSKRRHGK